MHALPGEPESRFAVAINGVGQDIPRLAPVMAKPGRTEWPTVTYIAGLERLGEFRGVLNRDLPYDAAIGIQRSNVCQTAGLAKAYVYCATAASMLRGAPLVPSQDGGLTFALATMNTGIALDEDLSDRADGDLVEARIYLAPGVVDELRPVYYFAAPALGSATYYKTGQATSNSVTTTVTSFSNSGAADYPRNVVITPGGTTGDVPAGDVVVTGTDITGAVITESFTFAANAVAATVGSKAFKTITSVVFPIQDGGAATYDIGTGAKLGLARCFPSVPLCLGAFVDGTKEGTLPTLAADLDELCKNTISFNTALNGAKHFKAILLAV